MIILKLMLALSFHLYLPVIMCISDHAMSAREEFILLENEFEKLKKKAKLETRAYDKLKLSLLDYKAVK